MQKEEREDKNSNCWLSSGYVMGVEFHSLVNQQASMPKCDPKKKAIVGDQNFLGSTKQDNKLCSRSFSKICSPPKEYKKISAIAKGDQNRGVHVGKSSSPATDTRKELSTSPTIHAPNEPLPADDIDALNGISLMSQEVQHDGTTTAIKGQRSGIF
jgi:hypothetical protein